MADYEFLTEATLPAYLAGQPDLAARVDPADLVECREVGDGNLNLVFLVRGRAGRGLCLKQALPYLRLTGQGWPLTPDRARHEAESLGTYGGLTPTLVPEVYLYDAARHIIAMENLSDHLVWRTALNQGLRHDGAAQAMGVFVGATAFGTSAFALEREALGQAMAAAINPQLCQTTEDLVFTEPLVDAGRNAVLAANQPDVAAFQSDPAMVAEMGLAKWLFMTKAEALIHGDLHTGSVMVRSPAGSTVADSVKAFDSEFAFYGPVAFDLGALFANYVIAAARAFALGENERAAWCLTLIPQTWASFEAEFRSRWPSRRDPRLWGEAFLDNLFATWQAESWLFAAAKMSRRVIGLAKAADIETLPPALREGAARGLLQVAQWIATERRKGASPVRLIEIACRVLIETRTG